MNLIRIPGEAFVRERDRWLLWAPLGIGAGIVTYFQLPFEPSLKLLAATPLFAGLVWLLRRWIWLAGGTLVLFVFFLGFNAAQIESRIDFQPMMDKEMGPLPVEGRLLITEAMPDGLRFTLKNPKIPHLQPERTPDRIRVRMNGLRLTDSPQPGSEIRLLAQVGPFSEPVMPHAYDFRRQSYFMELGGTGWARGNIEVLDQISANSFGDAFNLAFERARRALTLHVYERLSGDEAGMTAALLNGEQNSISKDALQDMRVSGISHLLSISGVHVSMMGLLVYIPLRALLALIPWVALRFPIKKWAAAMAIVATSLYTVLVGPQAPTLRSALFTGILMLAIIVDRRAVSMRLVTLAAGMIMLIQPDGVMGPSFEMSFAAVLAMVAAFEKSVDEALVNLPEFNIPAWIKYLGKHIVGVVSVSLVATAATAPFTIYHFQTFSFYGVIANMIAIPLTSFWIMPCILMTYLAAPFGMDGIFISGAGWGVHILLWLAHVVAAWPFALLYMKAMPATVLVVIVLGGLWLCLWRRRWRFLGLVPIAIGMLYPLYTSTPDFIVTADGKEWAARMADGKLAVSNLDREHFTVDQWQKRLGSPDLVDIYELPPGEQQLRCDQAGCVYHHGKSIMAMPQLEAAALKDCERANIVVAPFSIGDCDAAFVIDEAELWHHGAHVIYFNGNDTPRIEYTRARRGMRPWSVGWKGD